MPWIHELWGFRIYQCFRAICTSNQYGGFGEFCSEHIMDKNIRIQSPGCTNLFFFGMAQHIFRRAKALIQSLSIWRRVSLPSKKGGSLMSRPAALFLHVSSLCSMQWTNTFSWLRRGEPLGTVFSKMKPGEVARVRESLSRNSRHSNRRCFWHTSLLAVLRHQPREPSVNLVLSTSLPAFTSFIDFHVVLGRDEGCWVHAQTHIVDFTRII